MCVYCRLLIASGCSFSHDGDPPLYPNLILSPLQSQIVAFKSSIDKALECKTTSKASQGNDNDVADT